jgi:hypothetical protein
MIPILPFLDELVERDEYFNLFHFIPKVKRGEKFSTSLTPVSQLVSSSFLGISSFEFPFSIASLVGLSFFDRLMEGMSSRGSLMRFVC